MVEKSSLKNEIEVACAYLLECKVGEVSVTEFHSFRHYRNDVTPNDYNTIFLSLEVHNF